MVVVIVPLTFLSHYRLPMSDCGSCRLPTMMEYGCQQVIVRNRELVPLLVCQQSNKQLCFVLCETSLFQNEAMGKLW
ncbi:hypothetical protein ACVW0Q_000218 [Thermostichus sp. MS-CIW-21]